MALPARINKKAQVKQQYTVTNPTYGFTHDIYHAGDEHQFEDARNMIPIQPLRDSPSVLLNQNLFKTGFPGTNIPIVKDWEGYSKVDEDRDGNSVLNTFRYLFYKFKKGIFIKIQANKLRTFLPFLNANYSNEWSQLIVIDPRYKDDFFQFAVDITKLDNILNGTKHKIPTRDSIEQDKTKWYANNCIFRYEVSTQDRETDLATYRQFLTELCEQREIPDIEFFLNRRDQPLIRQDMNEPYTEIWGNNHPLVSHRYKKYAPILSMSAPSDYADVLIPTYEDWERVNKNELLPEIPWEKKIETAIFRGASTGCGVTPSDNMRIKVAIMGRTQPVSDPPYLNTIVTKWQVRPRKNNSSPYVESLTDPLIKQTAMYYLNNARSGAWPPLSTYFISPVEQAKYKYILYIDGHASAFRLTRDLGLGSVILLVESNWKMWVSDMIQPWVHYVPVNANLEDDDKGEGGLYSRIKWCREHDDECHRISQNAKMLYNTYLGKKGVLDFFQAVLVELKEKITTVLAFPVIQQKHQLTLLDEIQKSFPNASNKTWKDIKSIPDTVYLTASANKAIEWVVRMLVNTDSKSIFKALTGGTKISKAKRDEATQVSKYMLAGVPVTVKSNIIGTIKFAETINDAFIGINCINSVANIVPNFAYTFGSWSDSGSYYVVNKFVAGESLEDFIKSPAFTIPVYIEIIAQLSLALISAQVHCGFVHNDMYPWNIIVNRLPETTVINYPISQNNHPAVVSLSTQVLATIIDYGKSHVVFENQHFGTITPYVFKGGATRDIVALITSSLYEIVKNETLVRRLTREDHNILLSLYNLFYDRELPASRIDPAFRDILHYKKKYNVTLQYPDNPSLTPLELFNHIRTLHGRLSVTISSVFPRGSDKPIFSYARQVFDYILSNSPLERAESYYNFFGDFLRAKMPNSNDVLVTYYAGQQIFQTLWLIGYDMEVYINGVQAQGLDRSRYINMRDKTLQFVGKFYTDQVQAIVLKKLNIRYTYIPTLIEPSYTRGSFNTRTELPVDSRLLETDNVVDDIEVIKSVLRFGGQFTLNEEHRRFIETEYNDMLTVNPLIMQLNIATVITPLKVLKQADFIL